MIKSVWEVQNDGSSKASIKCSKMISHSVYNRTAMGLGSDSSEIKRTKMLTISFLSGNSSIQMIN